MVPAAFKRVAPAIAPESSLARHVLAQTPIRILRTTDAKTVRARAIDRKARECSPFEFVRAPLGTLFQHRPHARPKLQLVLPIQDFHIYNGGRERDPQPRLGVPFRTVHVDAALKRLPCVPQVSGGDLRGQCALAAACHAMLHTRCRSLPVWHLLDSLRGCNRLELPTGSAAVTILHAQNRTRGVRSVKQLARARACSGR